MWKGLKTTKYLLQFNTKTSLGTKNYHSLQKIGNIVDSENNFHKTKGYILLATIQAEPILCKYNSVLTRDDILTANKYLRNQTQSSKKDYHFGTKGHIYDFGYGPVYTSNIETKHTVDKFSKSKYFLF